MMLWRRGKVWGEGCTAPLSYTFDDGLRWPDTPARTWLLESGWITRGGGRIDPAKVKR
jgi:hypothetical protein